MQTVRSKSSLLLLTDSLPKGVKLITAREFNRELKRISRDFKSKQPDSTFEKIAFTENLTFRNLVLIGKAIDKTGLFYPAIARYQHIWKKTNKERPDIASRMLNGYLGIYNMLHSISRMYASHDKKALASISALHDTVRNNIGSDIAAITTMAVMAETGYKYLALALDQADTAGTFDEALAKVKKNFKEGRAVSVSDEDRLLNGIYRTFELCTLWAVAVDPDATAEVRKLTGSISSQSRAAEDVAASLLVAVNHLYKITHMIAKGFAKRF
ncbi:MAG: hypothetical protein GXO82_01360 [Chlorobi bacterium]|nr:hypothetical protein [Chlorobiota bacterium]